MPRAIALSGVPAHSVPPLNPESAWFDGDQVVRKFGELTVNGYNIYKHIHGRCLEVWVNGANVTRWCYKANDTTGLVTILHDERHQIPGGVDMDNEYPYSTVWGDVAIIEGCIDVGGHEWVLMHGAQTQAGLQTDKAWTCRRCMKCRKQEELGK